MSKKDYEAIAIILRDAPKQMPLCPPHCSPSEWMRQTIGNELMMLFLGDNPRFSTIRFAEAANLP